MRILTNYETLKRLERGVPDISIRLEKAKILYGKTVFLSHATANDDLVPGVLVLLDSHGGRVYVDHHDPSLPDSDCIEIAQHLRTVVRNCGKLVVLASPKSKESKWIPWELGLGDGMLPQRNVALFPSAESASDMEWSEREYLGLYPRIVLGSFQGQDRPLWMVWDFRKSIGRELSEWLTQPDSLYSSGWRSTGPRLS